MVGLSGVDSLKKQKFAPSFTFQIRIPPHGLHSKAATTSAP